MDFTLYSDNETRVAEIAAVNLNEYGEIGNPVLGDHISWLIKEVPDLLALMKITWRAEYGSP